MNRYLELSIEYANQRSYLDDLFSVYPTIPEGIRDIDQQAWGKVEAAFNEGNNYELIRRLLEFDLFPIKDSYVAYLRRDKSALERNPKTTNRLAGRLYEMGLDLIYQKCSEAKETNRQIGPMFRKWAASKSLGLMPCSLEEFVSNNEDAVLKGSDVHLMRFAKEHLGYNHNKGLDLVARFNGKYVIGEAKFLTDFGGHQSSQFRDALATLNAEVDAVAVAVLDGVLYIPGKNKMYTELTEIYAEKNIMSALLLREFLYSL
ncbi:Tsp45I type II restriction enzyme [Sedimentisphaera cyanobacteriorum]|uniref:Tsp45I type II restriction enzyme n=1 Tax=Sedimentisphaera cyanobacteriorum TaxID=1940790 RepID=A0A1Q2HRG1_9BACT|nr:restriction endonuclease [Sedimentisphaera cyanobacteriorum]AQQ09921.1 Tsp45I type II restriction enzyme [Sedimentisphaera cyanobacteriorum]